VDIQRNLQQWSEKQRYNGRVPKTEHSIWNDERSLTSNGTSCNITPDIERHTKERGKDNLSNTKVNALETGVEGNDNKTLVICFKLWKCMVWLMIILSEDMKVWSHLERVLVKSCTNCGWCCIGYIFCVSLYFCWRSRKKPKEEYFFVALWWYKLKHEAVCYTELHLWGEGRSRVSPEGNKKDAASMNIQECRFWKLWSSVNGKTSHQLTKHKRKIVQLCRNKIMPIFTLLRWWCFWIKKASNSLYTMSEVQPWGLHLEHIAGI
jgi:hypothetical protein